MLNMRFIRGAVIIVITVVFVFGAGGRANAVLVDSGGYFLDTNTGWYWYSAVDEFIGQDWEKAQDKIDDLTMGGLIWELASVSDIRTLSIYFVPDALLMSGIVGFTTPDKSVWGWLSDEVSSPGERAVGLLMFGEPDPQVKTYSESNQHPWIGAFAISKPGGVTPPPVP